MPCRRNNRIRASELQRPNVAKCQQTVNKVKLYNGVYCSFNFSLGF